MLQVSAPIAWRALFRISWLTLLLHTNTLALADEDSNVDISKDNNLQINNNNEDSRQNLLHNNPGLSTNIEPIQFQQASIPIPERENAESVMKNGFSTDSQRNGKLYRLPSMNLWGESSLRQFRPLAISASRHRDQWSNDAKFSRPGPVTEWPEQNDAASSNTASSLKMVPANGFGGKVIGVMDSTKSSKRRRSVSSERNYLNIGDRRFTDMRLRSKRDTDALDVAQDIHASDDDSVWDADSIRMWGDRDLKLNSARTRTKRDWNSDSVRMWGKRNPDGRIELGKSENEVDDKMVDKNVYNMLSAEIKRKKSLNSESRRLVDKRSWDTDSMRMWGKRARNSESGGIWGKNKIKDIIRDNFDQQLRDSQAIRTERNKELDDVARQNVIGTSIIDENNENVNKKAWNSDSVRMWGKRNWNSNSGRRTNNSRHFEDVELLCKIVPETDYAQTVLNRELINKLIETLDDRSENSNSDRNWNNEAMDNDSDGISGKRTSDRDSIRMWGKRNWNSDSVRMWGKRNWEPDSVRMWGKRNWEPDSVRMWGKRNWEPDSVRIWGKRDWNSDTVRMWGKRDWNPDTVRMWGKRDWNPDSVRMWGKRDWNPDSVRMWGKRDWNTDSVRMWGKRDWKPDTVRMWGKRDWNSDTVRMWGKRNWEPDSVRMWGKRNWEPDSVRMWGKRTFKSDLLRKLGEIETINRQELDKIHNDATNGASKENSDDQTDKFFAKNPDMIIRGSRNAASARLKDNRLRSMLDQEGDDTRMPPLNNVRYMCTSPAISGYYFVSDPLAYTTPEQGDIAKIYTGLNSLREDELINVVPISRDEIANHPWNTVPNTGIDLNSHQNMLEIEPTQLDLL